MTTRRDVSSRLEGRWSLLPQVALIAISGIAGPAIAQDHANLLRNGDFEASQSVPQGWSAIAGNFDARRDTVNFHEGQTSFRLAREPSSTSPFAAVAQAVDAIPLRGKTVRFRAAVRVTGGMTGSSGGLWLRVDREGGARGFFDNMSDRPIRSSDWSVYEIVAPVADDAVRLTAGFLLNGTGPGWIDTASLEIVPAAPVTEGDSAPLSERGTDNLTAFTKLYGYVRWFSPYSNPNDARWDQIAGEGAMVAERAADSEALAMTLRAIFEPMAPGLVVDLAPIRADPHPNPAGAADLVRRRHEGVGFSNPAYRSELVSADPAEIWQADLGTGLSVTFPLTAPRSEVSSGTTPGMPPPPPRQAGADRATRLAATIIAWNVFRHFYPYFEDRGRTWEAGLGERLADAAKASGPEAFRTVLQLMVADLDDGHGDVGPEPDDYRLPFLWQLIENKLVITAVAQGVDPSISAGAVIIAIDGHPVGEKLEQELALVSASTDANRLWRAAEALRRRATHGEVSMRIEGVDGSQRDVLVTPVASLRLSAVLEENRPAAVTWLPQGAWYFDLTRLDDERLTEALERVGTDQPVIFDMRGYPRGISAGFLGHLADSPVGTPPFLIPVAQLPDQQDRDWKTVGWDVAPKRPRLRGRVAFLTDERAVSYAETLLAIVRGHGLADIVGEPTAGMNGNINPFSLPGHHRIVWTGMKVVNHDGSDLAGHGVQPTVPASATIAGIRQGRDEVLERAMEVVTQPRRPDPGSLHNENSQRQRR